LSDVTVTRPSARILTLLGTRLVHPTLGVWARQVYNTPALRHVDPQATLDVAECFLAAPTKVDDLVALAYAHLQTQTDRQFAVLTDPHGLFRLNVVSTGIRTPYAGAEELIASVLRTRTLEVTTSAADRSHPILDGRPGGAYHRFRAVHDLIGHVATGYGFDADGEYSAWLAQREVYHGLARWAAATELHGEISVLWTTRQFADHKATLLDLRVLRGNPYGFARRNPAEFL
jgi:hypothetical protein